jgi:hypothetical protein
MTGRDVICRDEVGRLWTRRAEETRLREGDVRHAGGCAVAQADGVEDVNIKKLEKFPGNAAERNVA